MREIRNLTVCAAGAPFRRNARAQIVPARLVTDEAGVASARLARVRPSGDPFGLLDGDGYGVVPPEVAPEDVRTLRFVRSSAGSGSADA